MTVNEYWEKSTAIMEELGFKEWTDNPTAIVKAFPTELLEYVVDVVDVVDGHEAGPTHKIGWSPEWITLCSTEYTERMLLK